MHTYSFEKLDAWKKAKSLCMAVYKATKSFPKDETFGLINQSRRSAVSICSNLAEGSGRHTYKDKAHFSSMAFGSLLELLNQLILAQELEFLEENDLSDLRIMGDEVAQLISRLRESQLANSK